MKLRTHFPLRLKRILAIMGFVWFGISVLWPAVRRSSEVQRPDCGGQNAAGKGSERNSPRHLTSDI